MGSSNQYTLCDGVSNRHFPLTMKFLLFFTTFCLLFHCYKSDFAAQLDAFISDTPAGYTVAQEVRNGQTCHCRVPSTTPLPVSSYAATTTENATTTFQPTTTTTTTTTTPAAGVSSSGLLTGGLILL